MSQENVEAVRLAYEVAYVQRSVENVRDAFAPDFVWHTRGEWPGRSTYGVEEMPQLFADLDETHGDFDLVAEDFTPIGDYVIATVRQSARLRGSDARIESTIYHLWHVPQGRPREAWGFSDRAEALEAARRRG